MKESFSFSPSLFLCFYFLSLSCSSSFFVFILYLPVFFLFLFISWLLNSTSPSHIYSDSPSFDSSLWLRWIDLIGRGLMPALMSIQCLPFFSFFHHFVPSLADRHNRVCVCVCQQQSFKFSHITNHIQWGGSEVRAEEGRGKY